MKKVFNIAKNVFVWLVSIIAIAMMLFTIISVTTFNRNDRNLFGHRAYIALSDSMSASDINAGDLVLVKEVAPNTLQEGDIIAFISQDTESYGEVITHKIRSLTIDANGEPGFITYGTTTDTDDETVVTYPYVLGKLETCIPKVGTFFQFLKTPQGYIVCIFIPFMLLILYQGLNCIKLFRLYKKEQMEEVETERNKLEAERMESQKLMAELQALKEQLQAQQTPPAQTAPAQTPSEQEAETEEGDK